LLNAAGVVLTKKYPSESVAYWQVIQFNSIENFPMSVVITLDNSKQTSTIPKSQIGEIIEFVDFNNFSIVTEGQFNKIKVARESLTTYSNQCKNASEILTTVAQRYDRMLSKYAEGNVWTAGEWIQKYEYDAKLKADALASSVGSIPVVMAGSKTFKNVRVTKVVGDSVSIMHEGGIVTIQLSDLNDTQREMFKLVASDKFRAQQVKQVPNSAENNLPVMAQTDSQPPGNIKPSVSTKGTESKVPSASDDQAKSPAWLSLEDRYINVSKKLDVLVPTMQEARRKQEEGKLERLSGQPKLSDVDYGKLTREFTQIAEVVIELSDEKDGIMEEMRKLDPKGKLIKPLLILLNP
jgi:hypothetical protein